MALTSISVILTVFVLNLHYRGPDETPVPPWLRKIFIRKKVSRGLCFKRNSPYIDEYMSDEQSHYVKNVSLKLTIENLAQELKEELDNCVTSDFMSETPSSHTDSSRYGDGGHYDPEVPAQHRRNLAMYARNSFRTNEDILSALKKIIERYERDDNQEAVMYEWRQVAVAVDRILFWIFLLATMSSTIIVLIVAPITKFITWHRYYDSIIGALLVLVAMLMYLMSGSKINGFCMYHY